MQGKDKVVNSVNRLNAMYLQQQKALAKSRKFKFNLATVLVIIGIVGILSVIL